MPNITILPQGLPDEADDAPKKFRNIDTEEFQFWWDGKPLGGIFADRMKAKTENITLPDGKTDAKITYEFVKGIMPNEVVTMPKYLVNYAAMHLARKIYKRKIFAGKTEAERSVGILRFVNPEEEMKLQRQIVADNFEQVPTETPVPEPTPVPTIPTEEKKEEEKKPEEVSWKCEICGFVAKNKVGLLAHKRFKHKT